MFQGLKRNSKAKAILHSQHQQSQFHQPVSQSSSFSISTNEGPLVPLSKTSQSSSSINECYNSTPNNRHKLQNDDPKQAIHDIKTWQHYYKLENVNQKEIERNHDRDQMPIYNHHDDDHYSPIIKDNDKLHAHHIQKTSTSTFNENNSNFNDPPPIKKMNETITSIPNKLILPPIASSSLARNSENRQSSSDIEASVKLTENDENKHRKIPKWPVPLHKISTIIQSRSEDRNSKISVFSKYRYEQNLVEKSKDNVLPLEDKRLVNSSLISSDDPKTPSKSNANIPGPAGDLPDIPMGERRRLFEAKKKINGKNIILGNPGSPSANISKERSCANLNHHATNDHHGSSSSGLNFAGLSTCTQVRRRQQKRDIQGFDAVRDQELLKQWKRSKIIFPNYNFELVNIESCLKEAIHHGKIPHLVCLLKEIKQHDYDTLFVLKDISGEITAVVHRKVFDSVSGNLVPNSILELQNISKIQPNQRAVYLNIVDGNIKSILLPHSDQLLIPEVKNVSKRHNKKTNDPDQVAQDEWAAIQNMYETGAFSDDFF